MVLKGVELVGDSAVDGGSYGDVWKAKFEGKDIAVKVLKVYQKSDIDKLLRVSTHFFISALPIANLSPGVLLRGRHLETVTASKHFVSAITYHPNTRRSRSTTFLIWRPDHSSEYTILNRTAHAFVSLARGCHLAMSASIYRRFVKKIVGHW